MTQDEEIRMNLAELRNKVDLAIDMFFARDSKLLDIDASEWAVAHRIALYLEKSLKGWNIDCEYNRVGVDGNTKHDTQGTYRRPDIIVHHRGMVEKEHNLLVIEVKIQNTPEDYNKLMDFTSPPSPNRPFQYQYGLALSFRPHIEKKWFPEQTQQR
jgi:hypothetical protein